MGNPKNNLIPEAVKKNTWYYFLFLFDFQLARRRTCSYQLYYRRRGSCQLCDCLASWKCIWILCCVLRDQALGMVVPLPSEESAYQLTKQQMLAKYIHTLVVGLGLGLMFVWVVVLVKCFLEGMMSLFLFQWNRESNVTSGASSDLQQATKIARAMVMQYGMSSVLIFDCIHELERLGGCSQ